MGRVMLFRVCVTLTPATGGWSEDCEERLVGFEMIEADSFSKALELLAGRAPDIVEGRHHAELNRRTFR